MTSSIILPKCGSLQANVSLQWSTLISSFSLELAQDGVSQMKMASQVVPALTTLKTPLLGNKRTNIQFDACRVTCRHKKASIEYINSNLGNLIMSTSPHDNAQAPPTPFILFYVAYYEGATKIHGVIQYNYSKNVTKECYSTIRVPSIQNSVVSS